MRPVVLHQDLMPPQPGEGRASGNVPGSAVFGPPPTEGQNPTAFANGAKILPEPAASEERKPTEPVHGSGGFAADRDTQTKPDYSTGSDSTLQYVTVFNPSVLPFKRMSAMDMVAEDYTLYTLNSRSRDDLTVGGSPTKDRDLFWGSLVVELKPGEDVPIPSVAPDMRILSYEIEPRTSLVFAKDGSDNFYVRTDETGVSGPHRLVFMVDADAGYFAPSLPRRHKVGDVARLAPAGLLKPVPQKVQAVAERAHRHLGLDSNTRLDVALNRLVFYFRGFEPKEIEDSTGDIYWDLFINKAGVCRHRSFAFMVTANALGIPTRYLTNEAHAWVEVWVPGQSWVRVDLGGAALRMQVDNAQDKSMHRPRGEDPFSQPPEYEDNYTQLEGDIQGLTNEQIEERRQPGGQGSGQGSGQGASFDPDAPAGDDDTGAEEVLVGPGRSLPTLPASAMENKVPTQIRITQSASEGYRGESLPVAGVVTARDGQGVLGVGGQRVNVWMAPQGQDGEGAELVGHTVSEADGSFSVQVVLPDNMELKEYELFVATPGDVRFAPALSK